MPRPRRFSALLNFPGASYGPLALRPLLRTLLLPDERIVGWSNYRSDLPFYRAAIAFALAVMPIGHVLAGMVARVQRGVVVLTDRRLLLLAHDSGPATDGTGVRADCPLETITVTGIVGLSERLFAPKPRPRDRTPGYPAADRNRRATPNPPRESLSAASLFIITTPDGRSLSVKVPYFSGRTASGRLREGLVLLAGGTGTEGERRP